MQWSGVVESVLSWFWSCNILAAKSVPRHDQFSQDQRFWWAETEKWKERRRHLPGETGLKACLFLEKIKGTEALDRHERLGLCNLLSIHSQQHQRGKTRLFSLGKILESIPDSFPTSKHSGISQHSPRGNDMFVGMLKDPQVSDRSKGVSRT